MSLISCFYIQLIDILGKTLLDIVNTNRYHLYMSKDKNQPELHLSTDKITQFQEFPEVMAEAGKAGLIRVGFVSEPTPE